MKLLNKREFLEASVHGLCGNTLPRFDTLEQVDKWPHWSPTRVLTIRAREKWLNHLFVPEVDISGLPKWATPSWYLGEKYPEWRWEDCYFQEVPRIRRLLNFEILRGDISVFRRGRLPPKPWNTNLRDDLAAYGTEDRSVGGMLWLKTFLGEEWEHLEELWDLFPAAVIEATLFARSCGVLNRKLVIWEVRDY